MTHNLKPRPGFDWKRVTWGRPDSPRSALCSYCAAAISDDEIPLMMWTSAGYAAQFCEKCSAKWFYGEDWRENGPRQMSF